MILIVGNNHDDVLYFESLARDAREEIILNKYHATLGLIFNQQVLLLKDVYTSFLSAALLTHIILKYHVLVVFNVGKCRTLSRELRCGDIAVSKKILFGDVDQVGSVKGTKLGQIPTLPVSFEINPNLLAVINQTLDRITRTRHFECTYLSSSIYTLDYSEIERFEETLSIKGESNEIVIDDDAAGCALACDLFDVPLIAVKVVESKADEEPSVDTYLRVLKQYSLLGKAVVSCIGELVRNDILRQEVNENGRSKKFKFIKETP